MEGGEFHTLRGPIDRPALIAIRDLFEAEEPLASAQLDDLVDPTLLEVKLIDGLLDADSARIDVQWTILNDYKYHYTDACDIDLRWGRHPHDHVHATGPAHYHPPPNASSDPTAVEQSCIEHVSDVLVTRAVIKLWRTAYHSGSLAPLNAGSNPP